MRKKLEEVTTFMGIGLRSVAFRPAIYSADKNPGFRIRYFTVLKNFPSKWVISLKKCCTRCQTVSFGSRFSCPQIGQYRPDKAVRQFKQIFSFLSFKCDTGKILTKIRNLYA